MWEKRIADVRHGDRGGLLMAGVALGATWLVAVAGLILCGEGIKHSGTINSWDRSITSSVVAHRSPALDHAMKIVTWMGSWIALAAVAAVAGVLAIRRRLDPLVVAAILVGWLGELLAVTVAKSVVQRHRPPEAVRLVVARGWSFPSGHTANAVVVFVTAAALITGFAGRRVIRMLAWVLAVLFVALVGFSRIELGVHWTTDVLASAVWASCWVVVVVAVLEPHRYAPAAIRTPPTGTRPDQRREE
jgi:membrane-associated phospholipid phosphatase